jgi:sodium transport system ATP-binding protein
MGVLSDARGLYTRLTARENIVYFARLHGMPDAAAQARAELLADTLDMTSLLDRRTEGFSQGERMKTALARALVHDPANIVLDEPTNGLDVLATRALRELRCVTAGRHVFRPHHAGVGACDEVVLVSHGRTVASGTVAQLLQRTGERDFEEAFVRLAFTDAERARGVGG